MEEKHGFQTDYHAAEDKERDGAVSGESPEIPAVFKGGVKGCTGGGHSDRNKDHDAGGKRLLYKCEAETGRYRAV